jgi:hypothetical protein
MNVSEKSFVKYIQLLKTRCCYGQRSNIESLPILCLRMLDLEANLFKNILKANIVTTLKPLNHLIIISTKLWICVEYFKLAKMYIWSSHWKCERWKDILNFQFHEVKISK